MNLPPTMYLVLYYIHHKYVCGQRNCVNYKVQVKLCTMHMYTTDFLNVMDEHTTEVSDTVSLDLTYFSNKFIESGFITQTAASEVLSKLGVSAGDKSKELLHLARQNYKISLKKQVWADKFIAVFSSQAAYSDLATLLRGETSTAGVWLTLPFLLPTVVRLLPLSLSPGQMT